MREMQRKEEIIALPDTEAAEVVEILANYGVEAHECGAVVNAFVRNPRAWFEFMMKFELGLEKPDPRRAMRSAITIAVSYMTGGLVPLLPYMLMKRARKALLALLMFGFAKAFFTANKPPLKSAFQTVLLGAIASASAFSLAKLFPLIQNLKWH